MKNKILETGLTLYPDVTITTVADKMKVSKPSVFYHFKGDEIKDAVENYAIATNHKKVIAQMITASNVKLSKWDGKKKLVYLVESF